MEKEFLEAIVTIRAFYQDAFSQLFQYTIALFALVGVIIPLVAGLLNHRNLRSEKESLEKSLKEQNLLISEQLKLDSKSLIEELIAAQLSELEKKIETKTNELTKKIAQNHAKLEGGSFHIQGNSRSASGFHAHALLDYAYATTRYIQGKDEANAGITLKLAIDTLKKINSSHIEDNIDIEKNITTLIECLEENNVNGRYTIGIKNIRAELKKATLREAPKPIAIKD